MISGLLDAFQPGRTIFLPGATGEVLALNQALAADPQRMRGVHIVSCLLPGMNNFDHAALDDRGRVTTFLFPPALRASFEAGRARVLPLAYSAIADYLGRVASIDVAVAHVAPPRDDGRASLGIAADFTPIAWAAARVRIAIMNRAMPDLPRAPSIALADADQVIELDSPLVVSPTARGTIELLTIARSAAALIDDGATLQAGIGGAPGAIWGALSDRRDLRIHSGMITEQALALGDALAVGQLQCAGIAYGSRVFYDALAHDDRLVLADTRVTHNCAALGKLERFHAINSALEVDLFGQANLEWQRGRLASGVGGAPDFARAAAASLGGRSMILMPATAVAGSISRIVARLDAPTVSLARSDVDTVVTEFGVAELRGRSLDERADALIMIAAPQFRAELERDWRSMRATF